MKNKILLIIVTVVTLIAFPKINFGQAVAPTMGHIEDFALFSTAGAVTSVTAGLLFNTHITGNIGAAPANISGFGNVDGVLHSGDTFALATTDLLAVYAHLNGLDSTSILTTPLGGGTVLTEGVYEITNAAIWLTGDIILDANNDSNAVFIFQLDGAFNTSANARVILINGAQACNVFWKVEGAVTMGAQTSMKGTIVANGAIELGDKDTLEGRALAINDYVRVTNSVVYIPLGCNRPILTGPAYPNLLSVECFTVFSSIGPVVDDGSQTEVKGDVGSNSDPVSSFDALKVEGTIHLVPTPSGVTGTAATDLQTVLNNVGAMSTDIHLLHPNLFGHDLVLTPHTYRMDGQVDLTDTVYLNAQGNPDAVFVFQIYGAFNTTVNSKVVLLNGAQAKNVLWRIIGAVRIEGNSIFNGTIIADGAIDIKTNARINGRALTINGAISTKEAFIIAPTGASGSAGTVMGSDTVCQGQTGVIYSVPAINNATSYIWTLPPGATITAGANTNSITVDFSPTATSGTWNITVQGSSNCGSGTVSANFEVVVIETTTVDNVNNQSICNNATTSTIVFSGGSAGTTYSWTNDNTSIGLAASGNGDINSFTGINNGTGSETATITIIPSMNGCSGASTSFTITVNQIPTMNSISDQSICNNDTTSTIVFSGGSAANTYNWTNDNTSIGLAANGIGDINSFTAINAGTNAVSATITVTPTLNGCEGTQSTATIEVKNCIDVDFNIPEGFSPNGDEINDLFVIRGIDRFPGNSFVIFNRWGDKLFEATPYKNTWNGKSTTGLRVGGDELPVGTYFYILDLGEGSAIYKGTIYLNR